jgi:hypothetical protein
MLILLLLGLTVIGLAVTNAVILAPVNVLQGLAPPIWLSVAIALGFLAWLMRE